MLSIMYSSRVGAMFGDVLKVGVYTVWDGRLEQLGGRL